VERHQMQDMMKNMKDREDEQKRVQNELEA
jgi:hypothetical protein